MSQPLFKKRQSVTMLQRLNGHKAIELGSRVLSLVLMMVLLLPSMGLTEGTYAQNDKVTLQLRWHHQFQFAGYYAALWKGYYADEGLDVTLMPAFDNSGAIKNAVKEVAEGRAEFGVGAVDVLLARDRGQDLSLVASFFQRSGVEFYYLPQTPIKSLADLKKMKVFRRQGDLLDIEYQAMLGSEGIKAGVDNLLPANTEVAAEDLTSGRYEVIPGYLGTLPYYGQKSGILMKTLKPMDYGIDFYGDSLFTQGNLAKQNPLLVERFRRASVKGWQYALEHPNEIAQKIAATYEVKGKDYNNRLGYNINQSKRVLELTYFPVVEVGNINPYRWEKTEGILKELGFVGETKGVSDFIFDYDQIEQAKNKAFQKQLTAALMLALVVLIIIYLVQLHLKNKMLARSSQRYQSIFNNVALGITVTDLNARIVQVNGKWCEMTGYSSDELVGRPIYDFIAPEERDMAIRENATGVMDAGFVTERLYLKKSGEVFWGRLYFTMVHDDKSSQKLNLGMIIDITEQKYEEETLKRAEERFREIIRDVAEGYRVGDVPMEKIPMVMKLERINLELEKMFKNEVDENLRKEALLVHQARQAAMGEMVANIAHQWRQPLNNLGLILTNLEDAYAYGELDGDYLAESTGKSRRLISRMSETIDDFRNFLSPSSHMADFSVLSTAKSVVDMLGENIRFQGIKVEVVGDEQLMAFGHANQMSQAVFSVVGNAIDALSVLKTKDRYLKVLVDLLPEAEAQVMDITVKGNQRWIRLCIQDNGGGMENHLMEKAFDAYFTTKTSSQGTGLGLYITKVIIENVMKGHITLENAGEGLKVTMLLPANRIQENAL